MARDPYTLFPHDFLMKPLVRFVPHFVIPNHITAFRMIMTPIVLLVLYAEWFAIGIPLFLLVACTDALDGSLARIRKQVTVWGTYYDPVADKLLIGSVVLLVVTEYVNPYIALILVAVEFLLLAGGWYRRRQGEVGQANIWGKIKMGLEVVGVTLLLIAVASELNLFVSISLGTLALALVFAIVSLLTYSL